MSHWFFRAPHVIRAIGDFDETQRVLKTPIKLVRNHTSNNLKKTSTIKEFEHGRLCYKI